MDKALQDDHISTAKTYNTLHLTLSYALQMMLDAEEYTACAGLTNAIEDLEIKILTT